MARIDVSRRIFQNHLKQLGTCELNWGRTTEEEGLERGRGGRGRGNRMTSGNLRFDYSPP